MSQEDFNRGKQVGSVEAINHCAGAMMGLMLMFGGLFVLFVLGALSK